MNRRKPFYDEIHGPIPLAEPITNPEAAMRVLLETLRPLDDGRVSEGRPLLVHVRFTMDLDEVRLFMCTDASTFREALQRTFARLLSASEVHVVLSLHPENQRTAAFGFLGLHPTDDLEGLKEQCIRRGLH